MQDRSPEVFLKEYLLRHVLYRHQYVAYRKSSAGNATTLKFRVEEGRMVQINNYPPRITGPRLGTLMNFMVDMGWANRDYTISPLGENLLKEEQAWN